MNEWVVDAKRVARRYRSNCKNMQRLTADYTDNKALWRRSNLLLETSAVEYAIAEVMNKHEGEITVRLWEMVYRDQTHYLYGAAQVLHISRATAKRYNAYFLKSIATRMGFALIQ